MASAPAATRKARARAWLWRAWGLEDWLRPAAQMHIPMGDVAVQVTPPQSPTGPSAPADQRVKDKNAK